jgi:retinol-binding protein 3
VRRMMAAPAPMHAPVTVTAAPDAARAGGTPPVSAPQSPFPSPRHGDAPDDAARRINYGLGKIEILPGNIGYLAITEFGGSPDDPGVDSAVAAAFRYLERTDAIIIDVSENRGGFGTMSHLVFSHFLRATPVPTIRAQNRLESTDETFTSLAHVPGPRRPDVPLFVLTSRRTVSAAEEFAFVLRNQRRATLVGERTLGAGHMNMFVDVGNGLALSVSFARVSDPATGAEWEQVGVQPHIAVRPQAALQTAYAEALRQSAAATGDSLRARTLRWLADVAAARAAEARPSSDALAAMPGDFDGGRQVTAVDGKLWYRGATGAMTELVPLNGGWYALLDQRVMVDAQRMLFERADGSRYEFARVIPPTRRTSSP